MIGLHLRVVLANCLRSLFFRFRMLDPIKILTFYVLRCQTKLRAL
jgi:hypothetical protein